MPEATVEGSAGPMTLYVSVPPAPGPWPGVVVVHDALGMTRDLRRQTDWLADAGYLAAAPDLYYRDGRLRCMFRTVRAIAKGEGDVFDDVDAVRRWLSDREDCTGRIGIIGFCMGGGFALVASVGWGYAAASVNYGGLPSDPHRRLQQACPIVASYGGRDPTLRHAADRLAGILSGYGVERDIKEYPDAGHAFLNDHDPAEVPTWGLVMGALSRSRYHEPSAADARQRIVAFFDAHLTSARG
jgi:carboxymethylenebutenolidase